VGQSVAADAANLVRLRLYAVRAVTTYLKKTSFARMSPSNLRLKLIKVGAVIIRNTCRIRVLMSDSYPYKTALSNLVRRLVPN